MNSSCPHCGEWLVERLVERGIALVCPLCSTVHHVAEFVAESGYGNDSALCRARHKADHAEYIIMPGIFISTDIYRPCIVRHPAK